MHLCLSGVDIMEHFWLFDVDMVLVASIILYRDSLIVKLRDVDTSCKGMFMDKLGELFKIFA